MIRSLSRAHCTAVGAMLLAGMLPPSLVAQPSNLPIGTLEFELTRELANAREHAVSLARAMPDSLYAWRPAPGVRSVGQVYTHIALGTYMVLAEAGVALPGAPAVLRGLTPENSGARESDVTDKADIVALLDASFAHLESAVAQTADTDWDSPAATDLLGSWSTRRAVLLRLVIHVNEHLGQSVAYARMNGVVPPWSR